MFVRHVCLVTCRLGERKKIHPPSSVSSVVLNGRCFLYLFPHPYTPFPSLSFSFLNYYRSRFAFLLFFLYFLFTFVFFPYLMRSIVDKFFLFFFLSLFLFFFYFCLFKDTFTRTEEVHLAQIENCTALCSASNAEHRYTRPQVWSLNCTRHVARVSVHTVRRNCGTARVARGM